MSIITDNVNNEQTNDVPKKAIDDLKDRLRKNKKLRAQQRQKIIDTGSMR